MCDPWALWLAGFSSGFLAGIVFVIVAATIANGGEPPSGFF